MYNHQPLAAQESAGEVGCTSDGVRVELGSRHVDVPIIRTQGSRGAVSVEWFVREDTAIEGVDFRECQGVAYFADGQTKSVARVDLVGSSSLDGDQERRFILELGNTDGGCTLGCYETSVTIYRPQGSFESRRRVFPYKSS